jgi:hypothetical protein
MVIFEEDVPDVNGVVLHLISVEDVLITTQFEPPVNLI